MKNIFSRGDFRSYRSDSLSEAMEPILEHSQYAGSKTTVFISHKHDDLDELRDIIGFLEKQYNVKTYIDSKDPSMPSKTSGETARRIKQRINQCDKFILLATNGAIESKWCNWELGYGDGQKYDKKCIALFPINDNMCTYKGNEYLEIYPYIVLRTYGDKYSDGSPIKPGYYVREKNSTGFSLTALSEWLKRK